MNDKNVLVCMLSLSHLPFTKLALSSLLKNTSPRHTLLVIDQGSNDETLEFLRKNRDAGFIELIENGRNLGIAASINIGMKIAVQRDMDFCFYSNDIVCGHNWLEELQRGVYKHEDIGGGSPYISPECTYDHYANMDFRNLYKNRYSPRLSRDLDYQELYEILDELHGGNFYDFTESWVESRKDVPPLYEWFSMVMYIKKSTIEKIGYFDEQFYPSHWEDLDYMLRMNNAGLFRVAVTPSYCFHWSTITTRSDRGDGDQELRKLADSNEIKFNKKWKIFLPYEQRRHNVPDGDKYPPMEIGVYSPYEVSDKTNNRKYDKWHLWEPEKYPDIIQL